MTHSRTTASTDRAGACATGRHPRAAGLVALALAAGTMTALAAVPMTPATAGPAALRTGALQTGALQTGAGRVVVTAVQGGADAAAEAVRAAGGRVLDRLPLIGGVSASMPSGAVLAPSFTVAPDRPVRLSASDPATSAPASTVRQTLGLGAHDPDDEGAGAGTLIAVVDTGVAEVPDLEGRVDQVDVSGAGAGDGYGHGTFVAGVAAGSGAASDGRYAGVAPGARILDVRVADDDGNTDLVTVLRGLEAAADAQADVVNLALSSYSPLPYQLDPLTVALGELWRRGATVVVPAGNDGPEAATITSPGTSPVLLTVGTLDEGGTGAHGDDVVADFSARGPAPQGFAKPELVAPGRSLVSLRAPGSVIDQTHGSTATVEEHYFRGSGTSFSTAVTAGAAAVLHAERDLTPDQVKLLLTGTAYRADGLQDVASAGAGGLDLDAALDAPEPDLPTTSPGKGKGNGKGQGHGRTDAALPGSPGEWQRLLNALMAEDPRRAAASWSKLSRDAKDWANDSWSALPADLRGELTEHWAGRNWAGGTAEQWAARDWAGRNWAGRNWAGRNWADDDWAGRNWAEQDWAGRNWAGRNWAGRNWAGRNWADEDWAGRNWAGRNWAGRNWAAAAWGA